MKARTVGLTALFVPVFLVLGPGAVVSGGLLSVPPASSGTVPIGGTEMYYEITGQGDPVLLVHAGIADSRMWDDQVRGLSSTHTVVRCDLRGFGRTRRGSVRFSHYRDLATLLDSLGIRSAHVVGSSFGASVALDFALAYPQRVRSLVLSAPAVSGAKPSREMAIIDSTEESYLLGKDLVGAARFGVQTWIVGRYRSAESVPAGLQDRVLQMEMQNYECPSVAEAVAVPLAPRAFHRLEQVCVPTMVLIGAKDQPFFRTLGAVLARRIHGALKIVVPDVAHLINMEKPELFTRLVNSFISAH